MILSRSFASSVRSLWYCVSSWVLYRLFATGRKLFSLKNSALVSFVLPLLSGRKWLVRAGPAGGTRHFCRSRSISRDLLAPVVIGIFEVPEFRAGRRESSWVHFVGWCSTVQYTSKVIGSFLKVKRADNCWIVKVIAVKMNISEVSCYWFLLTYVSTKTRYLSWVTKIARRHPIPLIGNRC